VTLHPIVIPSVVEESLATPFGNESALFWRQFGVAPRQAVNLRNFVTELKRRNVYKVAIAYGVVGVAAHAGRQPDFSVL
jgi:hypothetical protein